VCLGNHDILGARKAFKSGLSSKWIKSVGEMLETPNWNFSESFIIDNIEYTHGSGRKAKSRCKDDLTSVIQGHYHCESYIEWYVGKTTKLFAMQLGTGIDNSAYAFAYGKNFKKPHINVGVVLDNGKLPIIEYMEL
jgi:hypothetical protein